MLHSRVRLSFILLLCLCLLSPACAEPVKGDSNAGKSRIQPADTAPKPEQPAPVMRSAYVAAANTVKVYTKISKEADDLATEIILGDEVKIIKDSGEWLNISIPAQRDYTGWVTKASVSKAQIPKEGKRAIIIRDNAKFTQGSGDAQSSRGLPWGAMLPVIGEAVASGKVRLSVLGEEGTVSVADVLIVGSDGSRKPQPAEIVATAKKFLGVPYIWGGTSREGVDCSGFVYMVFRLNGLLLKRDAGIQYNDKSLAHYIKEADIQPGDVVYLSTYKPGASHCGIYIGGGKVIHASSSSHKVMEAPLDSGSFKTKRFGIVRFLPTTPAT